MLGEAAQNIIMSFCPHMYLSSDHMVGTQLKRLSYQYSTARLIASYTPNPVHQSFDPFIQHHSRWVKK